MKSLLSFSESFRVLTGKNPFPWQEALFDRLVAGNIPTCCDLPTGLGKTSVIAVWLIALAQVRQLIPRRLVYVVNRRTVVDQTTAEVEKLRRNLAVAGPAEWLSKLAVLPSDCPLAISTLRGQFADNREWSADPCRPAVIVGTVDMMGSRLLFGGYGIGFKSRPLHAGFLGQDTLIVHDEAHLEPAFQDLLTAIKAEQQRCNERSPFSESRNVHVLELSATPRSVGEPFRITSADEEHPVVKKRLEAVKKLALHEVEDAAKALPKIIELAARHKDSGCAVLVFATGVKDVEQIAAALEKELGKDRKRNVERLTGTMRGKERDNMVKRAAFVRFLQPDDVASDAESAAEGTVYLVCTSAGEVGVNISADHLVCDLSTFDSMAQRFGRVNRFGKCDDTEVDVVHPAKFDDKNPRDQQRAKTLALLQRLGESANPNAIGNIPAEERRDAFAPQPVILPTSDILFDAWSLTTITGPFAGRPALAPYLHGVFESEPPETRVAWREEVHLIETEALRALYPPDELLADYPLKPHELLRDRSDRVWETLTKLARDKTKAALLVWLLGEDGSFTKAVPLGKLADKRAKEELFNVTLLLPPSAGGLTGGMLDGDASEPAEDVADEWFDENDQRRRIRVRSADDPRTRGMRLIRDIDLRQDADETDADVDTEHPRWLWFELPRSADSEGSRTARLPISLAAHTRDVESHARNFAEKSGLDTELVEAVALAGRFHDLGKARRVWQLSIGNLDASLVLAKSGKKSLPHQLGSYRHEFGSVLDLEKDAEFQRLSLEMKDVVLHLVAAHHGRARPHFPADEIFDPQSPRTAVDALAAEAPRRFARLQRKYGRWHLAWLESLLRAADYAASANPTTGMEEQP